MEQSVALDNLDAIVKELAHSTQAFELALPAASPAGVDGFLTTPDLVHELHELKPTAAPTADMVWQELFVHRSPLSEPCRRVLTLFNKLGFRPQVSARNLEAIRNRVKALPAGEWEARVYGLAKLRGAIHAFPVAPTPAVAPHQPYALHWPLGAPVTEAVAAAVALAEQSPHHLRIHVPAQQQENTCTALEEAIALCQTYSCPLWVVVAPGGVVPEFQQPCAVRIWLTGAKPQPGLAMVGSTLPPSASYDWVRQMLELRGANFVVHTSAALQTPEQVASAWYHARSVIARTLAEKYRCLLYAGWSLAGSDIQHDLQQLLGGAEKI
jgi:hypothetical protein